MNSCQRKPGGVDVQVEDRYHRKREQREANANPLIKATTASMEPVPDINT